MANGSSRTLAILFSLVIGGVAGWLIFRYLESKTAGGQLHAQVGPTACDLLPKRQHLKKHWDTLTWTTKGTAKNLYIEFQAPPAGKDIPFYGMVLQSNGRYRVLCSGGSCFSGAVNPDTPEGIEFKYWQVLDDGTGKPDECDGMIIIDR
jgi:hypothetical protein